MHRPPPRTAARWPAAVCAGVVALSLFACCRTALALQPTVVDGADILAPETVDKANATIRQIKQAFQKDVMIETYAEVPKEMEADLQKKGKDPFYTEWVVSRAQALKVNGLFILIVKKAGRLQIEVGKETRLKAFTLNDRTELRQAMVKSFQTGHFDRGVLDGLEFIVRRMERNTGIPAGNPPIAAHPPVGPAGIGTGGTGGTGGAGTAGTTTAPAATPTTAPTSAPTPAPIAPATAPTITPAGVTTAPAAIPTTGPTTGPTSAPTTGPATAPTQGEGDF